MTQVTVNEATGTPTRTLRSFAWRILRRRTILALAGAAALLLLFHYVLLPWAIRGRVRAALDEAGLRAATFRVTRATLWATDVRNLVLDDAHRIDRVQVRYDVRDLWHREVDRITVIGATLSADPRRWPIETKVSPASLPATGATTLPKTTPLELPFNRLVVRDSHLVLKDGRKMSLQGTLARAGGEGFAVELKAADGDVSVSGEVDESLRSGTATLRATQLSGELLDGWIRTYVEDVPVAISGRLGGQASAAWTADGGVSGRAALEISGGSINDASDAKLTLAAGVFVGEASAGPASRPGASVKVSGADIATAEFTASGVSGAVSFVDLAPLTSAPRQRLSAASLRVGDTEFKNGQLEFEVNASRDIFVRQTRWDFLGGQVFANDVRVPQDGPVSLTLTANQLDVGEILDTYARDKLTGNGKLSGQIPVIIDGRNIRFGEGTLSSLSGGELKITDPQTLAQVAKVAGAATSAKPGAGPAEQVKQNIAEALKDFEYDRMTARLTHEPDGPAAYVIISGHGRTGAKQALVYEPRIRLRTAAARSATAATTTGKAGSP